MSGYGLIGTDTPIDDLLEQYFPGAPRNLLYEAFESEEAALLAALLMEQRGDGADGESGGDSEAVYYSTETPITVDSAAEGEPVEFDFSASTVTVFGHDAPVQVAFKGTNKPDRLITLSPDTPSLELSGVNGLGASRMWVSKKDDDDPDTQVSAIAIK